MTSNHLFSSQEMKGRLAAIRAKMASLGLEALITSNQANIRYATGFRGEPHTLLLTNNEAVLYTSFRTLPWAEQQTQAIQPDLALSTVADPLTDIQERLANKDYSISVDSTLSHLEFLELQQQFAGHPLTCASPIELARRIKSPAEIDLLIQSQRLNESIFSTILPQIIPGMSERTVQGIILAEIAQREEVDGYSFTPIVAVGGNAWEIHHLPDDTKLQKDDMVLLDLGVRYQGYASDMTRTVCLGKATNEMKEAYQTVHEAQEAAIALMRPGIETHAVDRAAREVITQAGLHKGFTHGLGHSIGLETHDPGLNLSPFTSNEVLAAGMAFTVEPGIYLENAFGIRTEDILIITKEGRTNITKQPKDLSELNC